MIKTDATIVRYGPDPACLFILPLAPNQIPDCDLTGVNNAGDCSQSIRTLAAIHIPMTGFRTS